MISHFSFSILIHLHLLKSLIPCRIKKVKGEQNY